MKKNISNNNLTEIDLAQKVTNLPSTQNEALAEIVRGLYQGKPLLGKGGLLTNLVKDLTQIALQGEMDSPANISRRKSIGWPLSDRCSV